MGSWLFSSNRCNLSSCELCTHPEAKFRACATPCQPLNAFRNALKTAPGPHSARHDAGRHMTPDYRPLSHSARHNVGRHMTPWHRPPDP